MNKLIVNGKVFEIDALFSADEHALGLMHQENAKLTAFVFKEPAARSFWMESTPSKLDLVFCQDGKVCQVLVGQPNSKDHLVSVADLVIEAPFGWAKTHLKPGDGVQMVCDLQTLCRKFNSN